MHALLLAPLHTHADMYVLLAIESLTTRSVSVHSNELWSLTFLTAASNVPALSLSLLFVCAWCVCVPIQTRLTHIFRQSSPGNFETMLCYEHEHSIVVCVCARAFISIYSHSTFRIAAVIFLVVVMHVCTSYRSNSFYSLSLSLPLTLQIRKRFLTCPQTHFVSFFVVLCTSWRREREWVQEYCLPHIQTHILNALTSIYFTHSTHLICFVCHTTA